MKVKPTTRQAQDHKLHQHGLEVIEGRQGFTAFRKLVQIRPGRAPAPAVKPLRQPMRR